MEETTTKTVRVEDGTITISLDKYHDLLELAKEKAPVIQKTVIRTPEMVAAANKLWGANFMVVGGAMVLIGALQFRTGMIQASRLAK